MEYPQIDRSAGACGSGFSEKIIEPLVNQIGAVCDALNAHAIGDLPRIAKNAAAGASAAKALEGYDISQIAADVQSFTAADAINTLGWAALKTSAENGNAAYKQTSAYSIASIAADAMKGPAALNATNDLQLATLKANTDASKKASDVLVKSKIAVETLLTTAPAVIASAKNGQAAYDWLTINKQTLATLGASTSYLDSLNTFMADYLSASSTYNNIQTTLDDKGSTWDAIDDTAAAWNAAAVKLIQLQPSLDTMVTTVNSSKSAWNAAASTFTETNVVKWNAVTTAVAKSSDYNTAYDIAKANLSTWQKLDNSALFDSADKMAKAVSNSAASMWDTLSDDDVKWNGMATSAASANKWNTVYNKVNTRSGVWENIWTYLETAAPRQTNIANSATAWQKFSSADNWAATYKAANVTSWNAAADCLTDTNFNKWNAFVSILSSSDKWDSTYNSWTDNKSAWNGLSTVMNSSTFAGKSGMYAWYSALSANSGAPQQWNAMTNLLVDYISMSTPTGTTQVCIPTTQLVMWNAAASLFANNLLIDTSAVTDNPMYMRAHRAWRGSSGSMTARYILFL